MAVKSPDQPLDPGLPIAAPNAPAARAHRHRGLDRFGQRRQPDPAWRGARAARQLLRGHGDDLCSGLCSHRGYCDAGLDVASALARADRSTSGAADGLWPERNTFARHRDRCIPPQQRPVAEDAPQEEPLVVEEAAPVAPAPEVEDPTTNVEIVQDDTEAEATEEDAPLEIAEEEPIDTPDLPQPALIAEPDNLAAPSSGEAPTLTALADPKPQAALQGPWRRGVRGRLALLRPHAAFADRAQRLCDHSNPGTVPRPPAGRA